MAALKEQAMLVALLILRPSLAAADYPFWVQAQEVGVNYISRMIIDCTLDVARPDSVTCILTSTRVSKPSRQELQDQLKHLDDPKWRADVTRGVKPAKTSGDKSCEISATTFLKYAEAEHIELSGRDKLELQARDKVCEKLDLDSLVAFFRMQILELDAHTCTVRTQSPETIAFTRKNENEWEAIISGSQLTIVQTIWRDAGGSWNYRVVRAGRKSSIVEFKADAPTPTLDCKWVAYK